MSGIIPILKFLLKKVYSVQNVMYMYETNKHLMHHKIVKYINLIPSTCIYFNVTFILITEAEKKNDEANNKQTNVLMLVLL